MTYKAPLLRRDDDDDDDLSGPQVSIPLGMLWYWLGIMIIASIVNWTYIIIPSLYKKMNSPFFNWVQKSISMAPTFSKRKARALKWFNVDIGLIPTRWESLVLLGFYVVGIILLAVEINTSVQAGGGSKNVAMTIGDRFGDFGTTLIPLLMVFAGRNNFLQFITRWNFSTFLTFHRWIARAVFLFLIGHVGSLTYSWEGETPYSDMMLQPWVIWGTVACILCGLMLFQGMLSLRRLAYEVFVLVHILFAVFFVVGAWRHLDHFDGFSNYMYASVSVWLFDRAVRLARIFSFGFPKATLTLLANDIIKVDIPRRSWWRSTPGGYGFIHFLTPTAFFQSHPFSIVELVQTKDAISMYCRIKGGVTHSLCRQLAAKNRSMSLRVTVEGPYGFQAPVSLHDSVVFIAGGNGIPGIISEALDLAKRTSSSTRRAELHWIVRDRNQVAAFDKELALLGQHANVNVKVYCTGMSLNPFTTPTKDLHSEKGDEKDTSFDTLDYDYSATTLEVDGRITWVDARPDIQSIVRGGIAGANRAVAFVTCASPVLEDEIRAAVRRNLIAGKRVDLVDQLQIWA